METFENTDRNISPKTYSFERYFALFRPSESQNFLVGQPWWPAYSDPPFSKSLDTPLYTPDSPKNT